MKSSKERWKPVNLIIYLVSENPSNGKTTQTPNEWRMVEDLLKNNDLSYPWMEMRKEIEKLIIELKNKLAMMIPLSTLAEEKISAEILKINKKIFDYNLSVPGVRLQRRTVALEEILLSIKQE